MSLYNKINILNNFRTKNESHYCKKSKHNCKHNNCKHRKHIEPDRIFRNKILVHNTIFVDIQFGDNKTGKPNNEAKPFKSINKAIKKAQKFNPSNKNIWVISISPGNYHEDIIIPKGIKLKGVSFATIVESITFNGTSSAEDLIISSLNKISIIINAGKIKLQNIIVKSKWNTIASAGPALKLIKGEGDLHNCDIIMKSNSVTGDVTAVYSKSIISLNNVRSSLTIAGNAKTVSLYYIVPVTESYEEEYFYDSKAEINGGVSIVDVSGSAEEITMFYTFNSPMTIIANKINLDAPAATGINNLIKAMGPASLTLSNSLVDFNNTLYIHDFMANGIATVFGTPLVEIFDVAFSKTAAPANIGTFASLVFNVTDQDGSTKQTGGIVAGFTIINSNYTVVSKDHAIKANTADIIITLPPPIVIFGVSSVPIGKLLMIKNASNGFITIVGPILNNPILTLQPNEAIIFQSDAVNWIIMSRI